MDTIDSAMYLRLSCLKIAPFGLPVVPEEYLRVAMSPKPTGALMDAVLPLPLLRNSSQETTLLFASNGAGTRQIETIGTSGANSLIRARRLGIPMKKSLAPLAFRTSLMSEGGVV